MLPEGQQVCGARYKTLFPLPHFPSSTLSSPDFSLLGKNWKVSSPNTSQQQTRSQKNGGWMGVALKRLPPPPGKLSIFYLIISLLM